MESNPPNLSIRLSSPSADGFIHVLCFDFGRSSHVLVALGDRSANEYCGQPWNRTPNKTYLLPRSTSSRSAIGGQAQERLFGASHVSSLPACRQAGQRRVLYPNKFCFAKLARVNHRTNFASQNLRG
jgi:hypothetical protein